MAGLCTEPAALAAAGSAAYQNGDRGLKEAVTNISHDLRTPLTAIRGHLDLLEREDLPPEARRYLELIGDRAESMTRLTEGLTLNASIR